MHVIQKHAEEVAKEISPAPEGEFGIDPITIITIIISVITSILGNCPKPTAAALKSPTVGQSAVLLRECKQHCECCGGGTKLAGRMFRSMLAKGRALTNEDAVSIITEGSDDSNLLI